MNDDNPDIDRLLQANADEQLSRFDWQRFEDDTAKRLAVAKLYPARRKVRWLPLAAAAAVVLAVGCLVALVVTTRTPPTGSDGHVTVLLDEPSAGAGTAALVLADRSATQCVVTLIESELPADAEPTSSSLCIVAQPVESAAEPARRDRRVAIARLF
jgi:hypothetical protein